MIKTIPMKQKCKSQNGCLKRPYKELRKEEKLKAKKKRKYIPITHLNAEFQGIARRDKKAFLVINAKK